ncbi:MAG: autotransporter domain-containing protein, partial [Solirubrobacteraceae bacterium]|nr:autotransporter domain-containing protein [Solirubrobacteraceae bacterium]
TVTAGRGGDGGVGGATAFGTGGGNGGYGGDGGIGLQVTAPGTTFTNTGIIMGGDGGIGGIGGAGTFIGNSGMAGNGGIGISGTGLTIDNTGGTISGGLANGGIGARANGVQFNGGSNAIGGGVINGNIVVAFGSTFAPTLASSAIGTGAPVVNGSIVFTPGTQYVVRVSPTTSDSLTVSGNANLFGAGATANFEAGAYVARQYTILTATSGLNGATFNTFTTNNLPANTNASLSYSATSVFINLALNFATPGGALTTNQQNVANAVTNYFNSTGGVPAAFAALTTDQLAQAAGETAVGSQQTSFAAMNQFINLLGDRTIDGRDAGQANAIPFADDAGMAYASTRRKSPAQIAIDRKAPLKARPFEARWSLWAAGYGGDQTTSGDGVTGSSRTRSQFYAVAGGADYRFTPDTIAGFALAGGGTNFNVGNVGSGKSDLFQAGAFIRHH